MTNKKASGRSQDNRVDKEGKDISDALDRIIAKAIVENEALKEMLDKINQKEPRKK